MENGATGITTVHHSGLERAHTADLADQLGVPYAPIGEPTRDVEAALDFLTSAFGRHIDEIGRTRWAVPASHPWRSAVAGCWSSPSAGDPEGNLWSFGSDRPGG